VRKQQGRRAKEKARSVDESVQTRAKAMLDPTTEVITVLTYGIWRKADCVQAHRIIIRIRDS